MSIVEELTEVVAEELGDRAASKRVVLAIVRRFGGVRIYLPTALLRTERDRALQESYLSGMPVRDIALRHRVTEQAVRRAIDRPRISA